MLPWTNTDPVGHLRHGCRKLDVHYGCGDLVARAEESGVHHWFGRVPSRATKGKRELVCAVTFHELRHDFSHPTRETGWTTEEVAHQVGLVTKKGPPAMGNIARYKQGSREDDPGASSSGS